jgi:hypothetical protein
VAPGGFGNSFTVCPAGQKAISGGWVYGSGTIVYGSFQATTNADGDSWGTTVHNPTTTKPGRGYGYCAPAS